MPAASTVSAAGAGASPARFTAAMAPPFTSTLPSKQPSGRTMVPPTIFKSFICVPLSVQIKRCVCKAARRLPQRAGPTGHRAWA